MANCCSCLLGFLWRTDEPPKRLRCIDVPVVDGRACRRLFPMHYSEGMVCAGQVGGTNCLVSGHARVRLVPVAVWNPRCCLWPPRTTEAL